MGSPCAGRRRKKTARRMRAGRFVEPVCFLGQISSMHPARAWRAGKGRCASNLGVSVTAARARPEFAWAAGRGGNWLAFLSSKMERAMQASVPSAAPWSARVRVSVEMPRLSAMARAARRSQSRPRRRPASRSFSLRLIGEPQASRGSKAHGVSGMACKSSICQSVPWRSIKSK